MIIACVSAKPRRISCRMSAVRAIELLIKTRKSFRHDAWTVQTCNGFVAAGAHECTGSVIGLFPVQSLVAADARDKVVAHGREFQPDEIAPRRSS